MPLQGLQVVVTGGRLTLTGLLDGSVAARRALREGLRGVRAGRNYVLTAAQATVLWSGVGSWIAAVCELPPEVCLHYEPSHLAAALFYEVDYDAFVQRGHVLPDPSGAIGEQAELMRV